MQTAATFFAYTPLIDDAYHVRRGIAFGTMSRYEQAIHACNQALRINPANAIAYLIRGIAYYRLDHLTNALSDLDKAIIFDPLAPKSYCARAAVLNALELSDQALVELDRAVYLDDRCAEAHLSKAMIFVDKREPQNAVDEMNRVIELQPTFFNFLCRAYLHRILGEVDKSESDCLSAVSIMPNHAEPFFLLAILDMEGGQFEDAIISLNQAIGLEPQIALSYYYRACAYLRVNSKTSALSDLQRAAELDGQYEGALSALNALIECSACSSSADSCIRHNLDLQFHFGLNFVNIVNPLNNWAV